MLTIIISVIFNSAMLFLSGLCDRIRGGWKGPGDVLTKVRKVPRLFEFLTVFILMLAVLPASPAMLAWSVLAAVLITSFGWQQDNGWRGRFVEGNAEYMNPDESHRWYHPVRFGALQGLLALPLVLWGPAQFAFLIYALILGQVLAMYLSEKLFPIHIEKGRLFDIKNAWAGSEFLGPLCTGAVWILLIYMGAWF